MISLFIKYGKYKSIRYSKQQISLIFLNKPVIFKSITHRKSLFILLLFLQIEKISKLSKFIIKINSWVKYKLLDIDKDLNINFDYIRSAVHILELRYKYYVVVDMSYFGWLYHIFHIVLVSNMFHFEHSQYFDCSF